MNHPQSMRRLNRLTALCAGVLFLATPAAWACSELGSMASDCPMAGHDDIAICHEVGTASVDCCQVRPAPEAVQACSLESARPQESPPAADVLPVVTPQAPLAQRANGPPGESSRLHDLGRYILFSSFLL